MKNKKKKWKTVDMEERRKITIPKNEFRPSVNEEKEKLLKGLQDIYRKTGDYKITLKFMEKRITGKLEKFKIAGNREGMIFLKVARKELSYMFKPDFCKIPKAV